MSLRRPPCAATSFLFSSSAIQALQKAFILVQIKVLALPAFKHI